MSQLREGSPFPSSGRHRVPEGNDAATSQGWAHALVPRDPPSRSPPAPGLHQGFRVQAKVGIGHGLIAGGIPSAVPQKAWVSSTGLLLAGWGAGHGLPPTAEGCKQVPLAHLLGWLEGQDLSQVSLGRSQGPSMSPTWRDWRLGSGRPCLASSWQGGQVAGRQDWKPAPSEGRVGHWLGSDSMVIGEQAG